MGLAQHLLRVLYPGFVRSSTGRQDYENFLVSSSVLAFDRDGTRANTVCTYDLAATVVGIETFGVFGQNLGV